MSDTFKGRVALITGGGGGIGKAIAASFAAEGYRVYITSRGRGPLEETARQLSSQGGTVIAHSADVTSSAEVDSLMHTIRKECGHLNVLVNAAGVLRVGGVHSISEEDFDLMFATNVKGLWLVTKAAVALLTGQPSANVIHISSIAGTRTDPGVGVYEATKAAVNTLTKVMAKELARHRIRVNAIAPGPIDTQLYHGSVFGDDLEDTSARRLKATQNVPFGRFGSPEEVARLALFLASAESDFISGSITSIDGAMGY